jgi:hypothetical protein
LFAVDLLALAFRFKTFSCLALIPSVDVKMPSVDPVADDGLSIDFDSKGIMGFENLVFPLFLLGRLPLDLSLSLSVGLSSGIAKSSRSIKSAKVVRKFQSL